MSATMWTGTTRRPKRNFRRAIELDPGDAGALSWYGDFLLDMRRFDEARVFYNTRAHDAEPALARAADLRCERSHFHGQAGLAILEQRRALETEPNYGLGNHFLGRAYLASRDWPKAINLLRKSNELIGSVPFTLGDLGYALAVSGPA